MYLDSNPGIFKFAVAEADPLPGANFLRCENSEGVNRTFRYFDPEFKFSYIEYFGNLFLLWLGFCKSSIQIM